MNSNDSMFDDAEEIKRKTCENIKEKYEKFKLTLKQIKEEFKKKPENKDMILSMRFLT